MPFIVSCAGLVSTYLIPSGPYVFSHSSAIVFQDCSNAIISTERGLPAESFASGAVCRGTAFDGTGFDIAAEKKAHIESIIARIDFAEIVFAGIVFAGIVFAEFDFAEFDFAEIDFFAVRIMPLLLQDALFVTHVLPHALFLALFPALSVLLCAKTAMVLSRVLFGRIFRLS